MINPEVEKYVSESRAKGLSDDVIRQQLFSAGWNVVDVNEILVPKVTSTPVLEANSVAMDNIAVRHKKFSTFAIFGLGMLGVFIVCGFLFYSLIGADGIKSFFSKEQNISPATDNIPNLNDESPLADDNLNVENNNTEAVIPPTTSSDTKLTKVEPKSTETKIQAKDCKSISDPAKQFDCLVAEYQRIGNSDILCGQSNDPDFRSGCYTAVAADKNSYPECKKVNNTEAQVFCILVVAAENGDSATCDKFNGPDNLGEMCHHYIQNPNENIMIDMAYLGRGIDTKNSSDCYKIQYSAVRQSCLEGVKN